jgi:hypothetical protein
MEYISAKEGRVITAWNKRGIAGLRSNLLAVIEQSKRENWDLGRTVGVISVLVWGALPLRLWEDGERIVGETLGLVGVEVDDWRGEVLTARMNEEELREEIGDE